MSQDINIKITDRDGITHDIVAPTDMAMNLMEVVRSYELAPEVQLVFVAVWLCVPLANATY